MNAQQDSRPERDRDRTPAGVDSLELATLLDDEVFEERLGQSRPIAVTGAPFAGRHLVLDYATDALDGERIRLDPGVQPERVVDRLGAGPVVVENCQHLFDRAVGGFDGLERTMNAIARTDGPVVTGWNRFAWEYLDAVQNIGDTFDQFELGSLTAAELEELIREERGSLPTFESEELDESLFTTHTVELGPGDRVLRIQVPDTIGLKSRFSPSTDPKEVTFSRLTAVSNGNPGVALTLWDRCLSDDAHCAADITLPTVDIDREGAFLLWLVLSNETVARDRLDEWFGSRLDQLLGVLDRRGIVTEESGRVRIEPVGVPVAISKTETERIL